MVGCKDLEANGHGAAGGDSGGANIAPADGSVRFPKSTTAKEVVRALGSRQGGEIFSADAF